MFEGLSLKFLSLKDLGLDGNEVVEDGVTFRENAFKKAEFFFLKTGMPVVAEDSGIIVEALEGELGVKTRRWGAGEQATDEEWLNFFMERMCQVSFEGRGASFLCESCCIGGDGAVQFFEGVTRGHITAEVLAPILPGLPLSSCFVPEGCEKVYAALTIEEKNLVSHRGKALMGVRE